MNAGFARSLRADGSRWDRGPNSKVWVCSATRLRVRCVYDRPLGLYLAVVLDDAATHAYGRDPAEAIGAASSKHWRAQRGVAP